jgi:hypothetical protein
VRTPAEQSKHPSGIGFIHGFTQNLVINHYNCIRAYHKRITILPGNLPGFRASGPHHVILWCEIRRQARFIELTYKNAKIINNQ